LNAYADTSFLVSLYFLDTNSGEAAKRIEVLGPTLLFTPFLELELSNAFELRIFRGHANSSEVVRLYDQIREDIDSGFLSLQAMPDAVYQRARDIARERTGELGVRSLDVLHVASALLLKADAFLTFDQRQAKLARAEGLSLR
jgi:predicted nucleic acid-binding protein